MDDLINTITSGLIGLAIFYGVWYILPKRLKGQWYIWSKSRKLNNNLKKYD